MSLRPRPSRRDLIAGAAGTLALASAGRAAAQVGKPNIVFILADDLGYADVSCYGQRDYTTPNVDRLALEGMRFTQAYANSSVCSATRTALITGRYQYRLPVGLGSRSMQRRPGISACRRAIPRCRRCSGLQAIAPRWSASGISAPCRTSARSRAATSISSAFSEAPPTISTMVATLCAAAPMRAGFTRKRCR
jgi:hypothetical protein